jgi:hypothetical protein
LYYWYFFFILYCSSRSWLKELKVELFASVLSWILGDTRCWSFNVELAILQYSVIENFGFPLAKHFGRQLLSSSKKLPETSGFPTETLVFESKLRVFEPKLQVYKPKLQVFESTLFISHPKFCVFKNRSFVFSNQSCSFCKDFFCPNETSGDVDSGIFCNRNFRISNPYEVFNEVLIERKTAKFSKIRAKMNYCVGCNFFEY